MEPYTRFLLAMADDKFVLGHCNSDWTGLAPFLEEDIAFSNIAQDEIAHAQELYLLAADRIAGDIDRAVQANQLAYRRGAEERFNAQLLELPDGFDWALAIARQFFFDHFDNVRLPDLRKSSDSKLAALAGKMLQEVSFHIDHFDNWVRKLGCGTPESRKKMQSAVDELWPHALGLFEEVEGQQSLVQSGVLPSSGELWQSNWETAVRVVLEDAGVRVPDNIGPVFGGRQGKHSDEFLDLLAELSEVYNLEPGASW